MTNRLYRGIIKKTDTKGVSRMKRGTIVNIEKTAAKIKQAIQSHGNDFEALAKKCNVKPHTALNVLWTFA